MAEDYRKVELIMALRNQGIRDMRVLETMERVPRDLFVAEPFQANAWSDKALPIACGQTISQPFVVAAMTQALDLNDRCKVLEIGTGSGYQTAVLANLCRRVYTIERYRTLLGEAEERFRKLRLANVTTLVGDGSKGWAVQAPFDRIIVTAAAPELPQKLIEQLAVGGVMVVPIDVMQGDQEVKRIVRSEAGIKVEPLMRVKFVPLVEGLPREA
ncbi:MAG: protein-L-isoaspartate(D-aspartate) O-methyltransferase [Hyphomicrobiales bacterium]